MAQRQQLQSLLLDILGTEFVYFQPPPTKVMEYPCIVYTRDYAKTEFANNKPYKHAKRYQVKYIDQNPDSDIPAKIADLPTCVFDRFYAADNLNHDVYKLFF